MYTDRLIKFALKQTAIIAAVLFSIPMIGGTAVLLLSTLAEFLCSQVSSTMILTVVVTALFLAMKQFRSGSTPPESAKPDLASKHVSGITCSLQAKEILP
ncbi:MAG: hypothetical protein KJ064_28080 [Anaerolineae bacterium]|nr:hypothetical protein [Anaerolineae bacterium]